MAAQDGGSSFWAEMRALGGVSSVLIEESVSEAEATAGEPPGGYGGGESKPEAASAEPARAADEPHGALSGTARPEEGPKGPKKQGPHGAVDPKELTPGDILLAHAGGHPRWCLDPSLTAVFKELLRPWGH